MSTPTTSILPFILLLVFIVLLAGVLVVVFFASRRKADPAQLPETSPADASALPADRFDPIGSLYRDRRTGELVVERQGHPYRSADGLAGAGRKELENAARELLVWLELVPRPLPATQAAPAGAAFPLSPAVRLGEPVAARRPAATSMVAQIDEILQDMLTVSTLPNRDIHLTERPGSGVLVWIGAQRYEGVDAVPEGEVKTILRAAVQEWERRQGV